MSLKQLERPAKQIDVWDTYDVAVVGGGIAGVAAALAAARNGAKTCLIEKYAGLGGLATLGHVIIYFPLCDGCGRQVSFGIAEELLKLPMQYSACKPEGAWANPANATREELCAKRYRLSYDPGPMVIGLEHLLDEAGVEIIYDTVLVDVARDDANTITHLVVENKSGCGAFGVSTVVDCSGEADVCYRCGEEMETAVKNVRSAWYYAVDAERNVSMGHAVDPYSKVDERPEMMRFDGTDYRSVSQQIIESRKLILEDITKRNEQRKRNGESEQYPFYAPAFHGFRMTRHVVSSYVMTPMDMHQWHDDAVGIFSDWRKVGPVYALPYRAICAVQTPNLLVAGRCMSSTGDTWDITRVIPVCAVSGEAAGTAAALCARLNVSVQSLSVAGLQQQLIEQGMVLSADLVQPIE